MRHPSAPAGRTDIAAQNIDLFPTLGNMLGLDVPRVDGMDLRAGVPADRIRVTVGMTNRQHHGMVMRQGSEKFIVNCAPEYSEEYYDLAADPQEERDILLDRIDEVEQMFLVLEEIAGGEPCEVIYFAVKDVDPTEGLDEKIIEKLKSLGYLQ
jgi:arylsulfatase A-like enzyme